MLEFFGVIAIAGMVSMACVLVVVGYLLTKTPEKEVRSRKKERKNFINQFSHSSEFRTNFDAFYECRHSYYDAFDQGDRDNRYRDVPLGKFHNKLKETGDWVERIDDQVYRIFEQLKNNEDLEGYRKADEFYTVMFGSLAKLLDKNIYFSMLENPDEWENVEEQIARIEEQMEKFSNKVQQQSFALNNMLLNRMPLINDSEEDEENDSENGNNKVLNTSRTMDEYILETKKNEREFDPFNDETDEDMLIAIEENMRAVQERLA